VRFEKLPVNGDVARLNRRVEEVANRAVRGWDRFKEKVGLPGRRAAYDDDAYEFVGGARDTLRKKHYDKSLRLLWKAEQIMPWSTFKDANDAELAMSGAAEHCMTAAERAARARLSTQEFRDLLDREYTAAEKRAIVAILSKIGHGEAYAWLVSASMLNEVKSTGARAAVTMQIMEEAKHFVVLRELVRAFGVPVPRQSAWEYLLLEGCLKAHGLNRFFGMNVLVETIALSLFGVLADKPGLEVLNFFHLDESRHTALPDNYFREFPMSEREKRDLRARVERLLLVLPALPLVVYLEPEFAEIGVDAFDFGGSVLRKAACLADRAGFYLPQSMDDTLVAINRLFNAYCAVTRKGHRTRNFMVSETSRGEAVVAVEREIFGAAPPPAAIAEA